MKNGAPEVRGPTQQHPRDAATSLTARGQVTDSKLEHNNWRFPNNIKIRPLRGLDDDDFLINHKVGFVAKSIRGVTDSSARSIGATMIAQCGSSCCRCLRHAMCPTGAYCIAGSAMGSVRTSRTRPVSRSRRKSKIW